MTGHLKKTYFKLLVPVVVGFICVYLLKIYDVDLPSKFLNTRFFSASVLIISAVFSVAGPVFLRTIFAYRTKGKDYTPLENFIRFEKNLIRLALIAPYCAVIAYLFDLPYFYMAGTFLISLYAVYYFYPSKRRIKFEEGIFRVK
jgi:hypothetical protein